MSAQDHLSPAQRAMEFYHGTNADVPVGGMIHSADVMGNAADSSAPGVGNPTSHAYFTANMATADYYASTRSVFGGEHRVYTVEPTGEYEDDPKEVQAYKSPHPLRVTGIVPPA